VVILIYIYFKNPLPGSYFMINRQCFYNLKEYLSVTIPSAVLMCADFWAFDLIGLFAILLGQSSYDVHVILINIYFFLCCLIEGLGTACTIMISNALGQKNAKLAQKVILVQLIYGLFLQSICAFLMFIFKRWIIELYTSDILVIEEVLNIINLLPIIGLIDLTQFVLNNYCKSCTKLCQTMTICFINFYGLLFILIIYFTMVVKFGVYGIWFSVLIIVCCLNFSFYLLITTFDYDQIVETVENQLLNDNKYILEAEANKYSLLDN